MSQFPPKGTEAQDCAHSGSVTATYNPPTEVEVHVHNEGSCKVTIELGSAPSAKKDIGSTFAKGDGRKASISAEDVGIVTISCSEGDGNSKCKYTYSIEVK